MCPNFRRTIKTLKPGRGSNNLHEAQNVMHDHDHHISIIPQIAALSSAISICTVEDIAPGSLRTGHSNEICRFLDTLALALSAPSFWSLKRAQSNVEESHADWNISYNIAGQCLMLCPNDATYLQCHSLYRQGISKTPCHKVRLRMTTAYWANSVITSARRPVKEVRQVST